MKGMKSNFKNEGALAIGTQVSAKYKGAFCEAKIRSVEKLVKVRVTFNHGLGSTTISDKDISAEKTLTVGATVRAKHPDKLEFLDAVIKDIKDQSKYTVTFNDGDIATLRRNALCMKSGKHFDASESLDNLPLSHPEHFGNPVSGSRRRSEKRRSGNGSEDSESSSDGEDIPSFYLTNIGRVVWAENTDKKSKTKESWFPALIVSPLASDSVKIDTKEEFLIRSFKDGRYYTVSKKDTKIFHKDSGRKYDRDTMKEAVDKAVVFLDREELPSHWDREILFNMGDDSTTESSESEELDEDEDSESPEEKDRLVAELYKHMEDRGQPINKNPTINGREIDLYRLFKLVYKAGGQVRVTNKNMWQQVAKRLGFETTWCVNQVRVHYNRYLKSFEQFNRTLGCTMKMTTPKSSGRSQTRAILRSGGTGTTKESSNNESLVCIKPSMAVTDRFESYDNKIEEKPKDSLQTKEADTFHAPIGPPVQEKGKEKLKKHEKTPKPETVIEESGIIVPPPRKVGRPKSNKRKENHSQNKGAVKQSKKEVSNTEVDEEEKVTLVVPTNLGPSGKSPKKRPLSLEAKLSKKDAKTDTKHEASEDKDLSTAPMVMIEKKDALDDIIKKSAVVRVDRSDVVEEEVRKLQHQPIESSKDVDSEEKILERRGRKKTKIASRDPSENPDLDCFPEDQQYLSDNVEINVGDKVKVFYKKDIIYDAKIVKILNKEVEKWPTFFVHYQGWNARYDEWISRSRVAEKLPSGRENLKRLKSEEIKSETDEQIMASSDTTDENPQTKSKYFRKSKGKPPQIPPPSDRLRSLSQSPSQKCPKNGDVNEKRQAGDLGLAQKANELAENRDETRKSPRTLQPQSSQEKRPKGRPRIHPLKAKKESLMGSSEKIEKSSENKISTVADSLNSMRNTAKKGFGEDPTIVRRKPTEQKKILITPFDDDEDDDDPYTFKELVEVGVPRKTPGRPGRKPKNKIKEEREDSCLITKSENIFSKSSLQHTRKETSTLEGPSSNESKHLPAIKIESESEEETIQGLHIERVDTPPPITATGQAPDKNLDIFSTSDQKILSKKDHEFEFQESDQPILHLSKTQQELYPNLALIRTTSPSFTKSIIPSKSSPTRLKSADVFEETTSIENAKFSSIENQNLVSFPVLISTVSVPLMTSENESNFSERTSNQKNQIEIEKFQRTEKDRLSGYEETSENPCPKSKSQGTPLRLSESVKLIEREELEIVDKPQLIFEKGNAKLPHSLPYTSKESLFTPKPELSPRFKKQRKPPKKTNSSELVESDPDSEGGCDESPKTLQPFFKSDSKQKSNFPYIPTPVQITTSCFDEEKPLKYSKRKSLEKEKHGSSIAAGQDDEDVDLLCSEMIPYSPSSRNVKEEKESPSVGTEMPFASRSCSSRGLNLKLDLKSRNETKRAQDDTSDEEETVTPTTATTSMSSESPRDYGEERSKSTFENSEVEFESLAEYEAESCSRIAFSHKRKPSLSTLGNPLHGKRSRRGREIHSNLNRSHVSRIRNSDPFKTPEDDLDVAAHPRPEGDLTSLVSLDNEELLALTQRPTRKYNFFVEFDPSMESSQRVILIQNSIKELQKTYKSLKSNLAIIERRRKKIRRKEQERVERELSGNSADGSS